MLGKQLFYISFQILTTLVNLINSNRLQSETSAPISTVPTIGFNVETVLYYVI